MTQEYIQRLTYCSKIHFFKFTPLVSNVLNLTTRGFADVLLLFWEFCTLVHIKGNEHHFVSQSLVYALVYPNILLHLTTVLTSPSGEVNHNRFAYFLRIGQTRLKIIETRQPIWTMIAMFCFDRCFLSRGNHIDYRLCVRTTLTFCVMLRWWESRNEFHWSTEDTGQHIKA